MQTKKKKRQLSPFAKTMHILINGFMILWSGLCLLPLLWILMSSFKHSTEFTINIAGFPEKWVMKNYRSILQYGALHKYMLNSFICAVGNVIGGLLLAFFLGYIISRFTFPGKKIIRTILIAGMTIPTLALMVPIYLQFSTLNMLNSRWTLILIYSVSGIPMATMLIDSFLVSIPIEMEESAAIEGAGFFRTIIYIIIPLCKPIFTTLAILKFNTAWNEYPMAMTINNKPELKTLTVGLRDFVGKYFTDIPGQMAAIVVSLAPIILIYCFFSKQITMKITAGAMKG